MNGNNFGISTSITKLYEKQGNYYLQLIEYLELCIDHQKDSKLIKLIQ